MAAAKYILRGTREKKQHCPSHHNMTVSNHKPGGKGRAAYAAVEGTGVPVVGGISVAAVVVTTEIQHWRD